MAVWLYRGTLHGVAYEDLPELLALSAGEQKDGYFSWLSKAHGAETIRDIADEVLRLMEDGVPKGADDETIKAAYRELVHKYHPDKYVNHPLSDFATEKMKEINDAYDRITNQVASGNQSIGKIIFGAGGNSEHCELSRREKERRDKESLEKWARAYEKYREDEYLEEERLREEERREKERREKERLEEERRKIDVETLAKHIKILLSIHE